MSVLLIDEKNKDAVAAAMVRAHMDRLYVFDLADDGTVITSRAPASQALQGESIRSYLSPEVWDELFAHLLSYSTRPIVVDTALGTGLVLPMLAPAASLGVLCIPMIPRDLLVRLAGCGRYGEFVLSSSTSDIRIRMSARTEAAQPAFVAWTDALMRALTPDTVSCHRDHRMPINDSLREAAARLSVYLGCPLEWKEHGTLYDYGDFEYPLFLSFLLGTLCLARRAAINRRAYVSVGMTGFGCTVGVGFAKREGLGAEQMQELLSLRALAERKNLLFDYAEREKMLHIRFAPVSKDWSYLELKAPDLFSWINER